MFFPAPENTRCLKMKNLQKQNYPITAYCSISKAGKQFLKGGIGGVTRGSDFSSALLAQKTLLSLQGQGLEAWETFLWDLAPVSYPLPWELLLQNHLSSPKTTLGKREKVRGMLCGWNTGAGVLSPSGRDCPMWMGVRALPPSQAGW